MYHLLIFGPFLLGKIEKNLRMGAITPIAPPRFATGVGVGIIMNPENTSILDIYNASHISFHTHTEEEAILMSSSSADNIHEPFIRQAIEISLSAVEHGNHPFGACLVSKDGQVLLTAENTALTPVTDITRHAELNLISMATQKFTRDILEQCTLYTSCEPCLMCTGALRWSGIQKLVYAIDSETLGVSIQLRIYSSNLGNF
jgi:tRNA(Arg) A34 adenosine deaminase TadA